MKRELFQLAQQYAFSQFYSFHFLRGIFLSIYILQLFLSQNCYNGSVGLGWVSPYLKVRISGFSKYSPRDVSFMHKTHIFKLIKAFFGELYNLLLYDWRESCLLIGLICFHKSLCLPGNWSKPVHKLILHENQLELVSRS